MIHQICVESFHILVWNLGIGVWIAWGKIMSRREDHNVPFLEHG